MVLDYNWLNKISTQLRLKLLKYGEIRDELRGWNWHKPPLEAPDLNIKLSVSEISSRYCTTMRDIYIRRVLKVPWNPTPVMIEGAIYHDIIKEVSIRAKRIIYLNDFNDGGDIFIALMENSRRKVEEIALKRSKGILDNVELEKITRKALSLWRFLSLSIASKVDSILSKYGKISLDAIAMLSTVFIVECVVDGSPLGLSNKLVIDAFQPGNIIVEFKTGRKHYFHKYALAGYALALECDTNIPVDFGILVYIHVEENKTPKISVEPVLIDNELRYKFIELRDEAFNIIHTEHDPGKADYCEISCPYYEYCNPGGRENAVPNRKGLRCIAKV